MRGLPMADPLRVLFCDLDGTLLDHTYRPGPARVALGRLRVEGVLVVPCSSKTLSEQRALARDLGLPEGFVVENGGAVALPPGFPEAEPVAMADETGFGLPYPEVRSRLHRAAAGVGMRVRGYGDMDTDEVARLTGLDRPAASRARDRRWSETFFLVEDGDPARLEQALEAEGLRASPGTRFWTTHGEHDKGTGMRAVLEVLDGAGIETVSYAVGDAPNDAPMLAAADQGYQVARPDGGWHPLDVEGITRVERVGPEGFVIVAERVLAGEP